MSPVANDVLVGGDALTARVVDFVGLLRRAGLHIGVARVELALRGLLLVGLTDRDDVRTTLQACLCDRAEQRQLFDLAFDAFWSARAAQDRSQAALSTPGEPAELSPRLAHALGWDTPAAPQLRPAQEARAQQTTGSSLMNNPLYRRDFAKMTAQEWTEARAAILRGDVLNETLQSRRMRPAHAGALIDWRQTLTRWARSGDLQAPKRRRRAQRVAPLVVLADISGSMRQYSRILLYFVHALSQRGSPVHSFVFGHHLSSVSRHLHHPDADLAVAAVLDEVDDWAAGTRIQAALRAFNHQWSRRVLAQNATVLLITDGLESDPSSGLAREAERLSKSCRRLLWLNPLLRYDRFEPRASGIRAMLPWVETMIPVHNLQSLGQLAIVLEDRSQRPQ